MKRPIWIFASAGLFVGLMMVAPSIGSARTVGNPHSETVICEMLDSAIIARETRGKATPPRDCAVLSKGQWTAIVLTEGDKFYHVAVPLKDGQYAKGWVSTDQIYTLREQQEKAPETQPSSLWESQFRRQVEQCWKKPYGDVEREKPQATFKIKLRSDGMLEEQPVSDNTGGSPYQKAYRESALRALIECQPYSLPAASFKEWRLFSANFSEHRL